ncbi:Protein DCL chloroplastic [Euphorbia peplus]|nr:Protein DCL chloroplastic [Euphorbia peplus]
MTSLFKPPPYLHSNSNSNSNPIFLHSSSLIFCFPFYPKTSLSSCLRALKTGPDGSDLIRKPVVPTGKELDVISQEDDDDDDEDEEERRPGKRVYEGKEDEEWVDWEDQILEDTVPLVGIVRIILHSGKYENGDRLSPEHEATILERLLPYHPEYNKKIGCGIDYITVGNHPDFETSRCMFIVRKDGQLIDFSYWKCIKGLIRKNYPLYADSFILRHFRRRRRS